MAAGDVSWKMFCFRWLPSPTKNVKKIPAGDVPPGKGGKTQPIFLYTTKENEEKKTTSSARGSTFSAFAAHQKKVSQLKLSGPLSWNLMAIHFEMLGYQRDDEPTLY